MCLAILARSIITIIIRMVAVYLETHCNIGPKRAFPTGVLDT